MDSSQSNIQQAKESARRLALQLGLALERHGDRIIGVTAAGEEETLVDKIEPDQLWLTAEEVIKTKLAEIDVKNSSDKTTVKIIKIYTDGGSRGNPGPSASGFAIFDGTTNALLEEGGEYLGITTNNQAEYHALRLALEHAQALKPQSVNVYMDSQLAVNQVNGVYRVKNRDLLPVYEAVKRLASGFQQITFKHIPREENHVADSVVNRILDEQVKANS